MTKMFHTKKKYLIYYSVMVIMDNGQNIYTNQPLKD